jgi:hypothetical protein
MQMTKAFPVAALIAAAIAASTPSLPAQDALPYQKPPAAIEALLDAPVTPVASISPSRTTILIAQPATFPSIADVAQPRYRLAGLRFNPQTNGPSRELYFVHLSLQPVSGGSPREIAGLPATLKASAVMWSPDSRFIAFVQRTQATTAAIEHAPASAKDAAAGAAGLELWLIDAATARAHRVGTTRLNAVLGRPCSWMPDSTALLCRIVPTGRGPAPALSTVPTGPPTKPSSPTTPPRSSRSSRSTAPRTPSPSKAS